eukprot:6244592-Prorocentrum_lima.AAC.1
MVMPLTMGTDRYPVFRGRAASAEAARGGSSRNPASPSNSGSQYNIGKQRHSAGNASHESGRD